MNSITDFRSFAETMPVSGTDSGVQGSAQAGTVTQGNALYPTTGGDLSGIKIGHPIIVEDPADWRKHHDVALLNEAEAPAQDAFQKVSPFNPNATAADKLQAQQEMQEAQQIRDQVEQDLDPGQKQALEQIKSEEQQAFTDATSVGGGFLGDIRRDFAVTKMIDAGEKSTALDNSILGIPNNPPPFPIFPLFGKIS
jgi:hypothetical protein